MNKKRKEFFIEETHRNDRIKPSSISKCLDHLKVEWRKNNKIASLWEDWPKISGDQIAANCTPISARHLIVDCISFDIVRTSSEKAKLVIFVISLYGIFFKILRIDLLRLRKQSSTYWLDLDDIKQSTVYKQY